MLKISLTAHIHKTFYDEYADVFHKLPQKMLTNLLDPGNVGLIQRVWRMCFNDIHSEMRW